jgi:hypothetical protein
MNSSIIKSFTQFLNENSIIQAAMKQAEEEARKAELAAQTASPTTAEPSPTVSTSSAATTSEFSTSRNDEMSCKDHDCWTWFGKEKFWNGVNKINNKTVPKILIDKKPNYFNITYEGPGSGFLLKHKFGGKGDTIHQLLNVLTLELNAYLETIYAKPLLSAIKMELKGNKLSVYVPLEKTPNVHYEIHRRGGLCHGGDFSDLVKYKTKRGYEEALHKSGNLTEKFVTFIK